MNNIKVKAYKKILKEVAQKYDGAEDFIKKKRIYEIALKKSCLLRRYSNLFFC